MQLSRVQLEQIRRHLRVPFAGYPTSGYYGGIRTVLTVGQLEYYFYQLQAEEQATVTGYPYGVLIFQGNPNIGDTVTAVINGIPVTYAVQASDVNGPTLNLQPISVLDSISFNLANAINAANLNVQAAGGYNFRPQSPVLLPNAGQVNMTANGPTFTLTGSATGNLSTYVQADGSTFPEPIVDTVINGQATTVYGLLPICNAMRRLAGGANLSLWLEKADVVNFRKDEFAARIQVYRWWCKELGVALSVGPDPAGTAGMGSRFGGKVTV